MIINISTKALIIIYIIISAFYFFIINSQKLNYKQAKASFFIFINIILSIFIFYYLQNTFEISHLFTSISIIFSFINIIILKKFDLYKPAYGIAFLFFSAFSIYLGYISYTPYYVRQHDSRDFFHPEFGGHFGYIGYLFKYKHLPNFSPKEYWCFFNPPLFYIISALFIKLQNTIGLSINACFENLQILSLIYTIIFDIYFYKILKKIKIEKSLPFILVFVLVSPAMIIMSGSLNNDILSIALSTMALFYAIQWFESDKLLDLIKVAFCISFAMMTKISSALIAIVIGVLFLYKIIKNKSNIKKYLIHFSIFAIIALPIGLWFPIKNLILYKIPPTYVQSIDPNTPINISKYSSFNRFFTISSKENLKNVNVIMEGKNIDYNIFFTTLKSFIIDENINYEENQVLRFCNSYFILYFNYNCYNVFC